MRTVLFVAPFLMEATLKFVQAAATVQNARIIVLTADSAAHVPAGCVHYHVADPTSAGQLIAAARAIAKESGPIHRVIGILENIQEQIAMVREALGVSGPDVATAERFRDKSVMKDALRAAGLPCARHKLLFTQADAHTFVRDVGFPVVLKPPAGAGCKATYRISDAAALTAALAEIRPSPDRVVLAEEYVQGDEHCYDAITIAGKTVFQNIGRYYPGPLDVTRNDWIQWCVVLPRDISGPEFDPVRKVGPAVVKALGLRTGMTHMEWFRRPDGTPVVSEIGARPPGAQFVSVMSWVHDRSLYLAWAQAVIDDKVEGPFERKFAAGVAFLRGPGTGRVSRVENLDKAQALMGKLVVEAQLPVVGREKSTGYEGDGFVIIRHPDTRVVENALETLIETVHVHYD